MLLWKDGQNTSLDRMEHNMCTDGNSGWLTPEHYTGVRGWWLLSPPKYTISYEFCGCDWILQLEAILTRQWWKLGVRDSGEQCGQGWKAIDKKGHLLPCLFHLLDCGGSSSLWSSLLFCLLLAWLSLLPGNWLAPARACGGVGCAWLPAGWVAGRKVQGDRGQGQKERKHQCLYTYTSTHTRGISASEIPTRLMEEGEAWTLRNNKEILSTAFSHS